MTVDNVTTPSQAVARPDQELAGEMIPFGAATSDLVLWAYEARQARLIAQSLAKTSFVPLSLRGKPDDITAAILAGAELGMKPMATLRSIDVIQGTPALRAHAMRALVQSHGHTILLVESTKDVCRMRGRRKGEDEWQEIEWDTERAKDLGLLDKSEWKKQRKTMLVARATGEICRLVASDVLHAMPYNAEELRDSVDDDEPVQRARVTVAEIQQRAPRPTPPTPVATPAVAAEDAEVIEPTANAIEQIKALFNVVEIASDEARAAYIADLIGRDVTGFGELTDEEKADLLDALQRFADQSEPPAGES